MLYSSENWTIKATDARRITATEMKYVRKRAGYAQTDYTINKEIAKELNITPILDKIQKYRRNWLQHTINRMPSNRLWRTLKKHRHRQKKPKENIKGTVECVRPEWANRWPSSMLAR
jgi:hypothetical protein